MRLKEKKPSPALTHEAFAIERQGRFVGCYQAPRIGVRLVKDEKGHLIEFSDKERAEIIASRRLLRDLDSLPRMKITREVRLPVRRPKC